jgi:P-type conjugative transfer protein TrbJ
MSALIGQSQGATGALQATQAGNQLLALQAQQLADLTAVVAANGRAQALTERNVRPLPNRVASSAAAS